MLLRISSLVAAGLLAYVVEYSFGLAETPARYVVYLVAIPMLILYALSISPLRLTGRLKGTDPQVSPNSEASRSRDPTFEILAIIYASVYLSILFRVRPRYWDRFFDIFLELSPVELFWLVAPITAFWWYRQRRFKSDDAST